MKKYFISVIFLFLYGCSMNLGTFSLVSTLKNNLDEEYESIGLIEGKDTQYMFLGIPTGAPRIDYAINDALIKNNAVYMTNASIKYDQIFFLIYFGYMEYKVIGEGWIVAGQNESGKELASNRGKDNLVDLFDNVNAEKIKKKEALVLENKTKKPQNVMYDPNTGLPIKQTKFDPLTGEPIYE